MQVMLSYGCLKELPPVLDRSYVSCDLVQRGRHLDAACATVPTGLDRQDLVRCSTLHYPPSRRSLLDSKSAIYPGKQKGCRPIIGHPAVRHALTDALLGPCGNHQCVERSVWAKWTCELEKAARFKCHPDPSNVTPRMSLPTATQSTTR